jgi:hypothetical protein
MDRLVYRAMKKSDDKHPLLGRTARTLGVRVAPHGTVPKRPLEFDVYPDAADYVCSGFGMSVAMDNPKALPKHRRPRSLGGEGRDPVFALSAAAVSGVLRLFENAPPHALIEPAVPCLLAAFETALAETRVSWSPCDV